jgi:hypothetical protein
MNQPSTGQIRLMLRSRQIDAQENQNRGLRRSESEKIAQSAKNRLEELTNALDKEITNIAGTFGIPYALDVLDQLLSPASSGAIEPNETTMDGLKKRITQQGYSDNDKAGADKEYENARAALRRLDDGPEDVIERVVNLRGWKKKFSLFKRECLTTMSKMNDIALQLAAQKQASAVYDQISSSAERLKTNLESTVTTLGTAITELEARATKLASPEQNSSNGYEFTQEVEINFADYYKVHTTQINPASVFQGMIPVRALENLDMLVKWISDEAKQESQTYAARFFENGLNETSLLDTLKNTADKQNRDPQKFIQEQLDKLVQYCHPFWEYDQNRGLHDMEGKSIIGIEDENHALIPSLYQDSSQYELKTTGFRDRIDVVRIQHGLACFPYSGYERISGRV